MTQIAGYAACVNVGQEGCQGLVLDAIRSATKDRCTACFIADGAELRRYVDVVIDRRTAKIPTSKPKTRQNRKIDARHAKNPAYRERRTKKETARSRAWRRLVALHEAEFLVLMAEERAKEGLEPWTVDRALRYAFLVERDQVDPSATLRALAAYHASDAQAEDVAVGSDGD